MVALKKLSKVDVRGIIELADRGKKDPKSPKIVSAADISSLDLTAHTEHKRKLMNAIDSLGDAGRAELNALMLLGRGEAEAEDFDVLVEHSQNATSDYIASKAPLSDYLAKGLLRLGE